MNATSISTLDPASLNTLKQEAAQRPDAAIQKAAREFEALFVQMLLKQMRQMSLKGEDSASSMDSGATQTYESLFDQQMSRVLSGADPAAGDAGKRGLGLADIIARQLSRQTGTSAASEGAHPVSAAMAPSPSTLAFAARSVGTINASKAPSAAADIAAAPQALTAAGSDDVKTRFIQRFLPIARKIEAQTGIAAEHLLSQAALESGWGRREIRAADGSPSFNLFGIKATGGWSGASVTAATTEYDGDRKMAANERFRAYDSYEASFADWAKLISSNPRYQAVASRGASATDFAFGLQRAGYATDPRYGNKLLNVIAQTQRLMS